MRRADLAGRRVAILGAGREGLSAARLLSSRDEPVAVLSERAPDDESGFAAIPGVDLRIGAGVFDDLSGFDVAIRSPGLGAYRPELVRAREAGLRFTSLTDLFLGESRGRTVVAVTGSKGKSTTVSLLGLALEACGVRAVTAGNIGTPVFDADPEGRAEVVVLEVSSYQACDLEEGPRHAVLTSLYPEHLDWHGGVERYYEDKLRLLRLARGARFVNARDEEALRRSDALPERVLFGDEKGFHDREGVLYEGTTRLGELRSPSLGGAHHRASACAALAVVRELGADPDPALEGMRGFEGLPHRQETVLRAGGVAYVDDSFSTIPQATLEGLRQFGERPLGLVIGGRDRGVDLSPLATALQERPPEAVALLGETGEALASVLGALGERVRLCASMEDAVRFARARLPDEGVVLLSPAAATGDEFADAPARGRAFAAAARGAEAERA